LGYAQDLRDAFAKYWCRLATFVEREKGDGCQTVENVRRVRPAWWVLAHPALLHLDWRAFENTLIYLVKAGRGGCGCFSYDQYPADAQLYARRRAALWDFDHRRSDFHGGATEAGKPQSEPASGLKLF
jgi:hypothetical protein